MKRIFLLVLSLILLVPSVHASSQSASEILKQKVVTSGDGLYQDEYEEGKYTFKGADTNNYIKFNDELWRIISVEKNGSLKIIRNEALSKQIYFDELLRGGSNTLTPKETGYCRYGHGNLYGCNAWTIIDNYVNGEYNGPVMNDSSIKTYLENEYYKSLTNEAKSKIVNYEWGIGPVKEGNSNMQEELTDEKSFTWNGQIGLITMSDFINANSNKDECGTYGDIYNDVKNGNNCKKTNYLANIGSYYFISPIYGSYFYISCMSPEASYQCAANQYVSSENYNAKISSTRPAVYLTSNISLEGSGTEDDPYVIVDITEEESPVDSAENNPQIVEVPATSAYASIIIAVLGIICILVSVIVIKRKTKKVN